MPQEQNVLKCFSCETFQVHIVKKAKKWECKICGAKQSFKHSYGQGSGKDCRLHVMKLNELRMKKECNFNMVTNFRQSCDINNVDNVNEKTNSIEKKIVTNKWLQYLDDDELEDVDLDNEEIDFKKNHRKRKRIDVEQLICENNFKKICDQNKTNEILINESKLPYELFGNSESTSEKNKNLTCTKDLKESKEETNNDLKDEIKLENKGDLFHCIKKKSNIFGSNDSNDLDELINISF